MDKSYIDVYDAIFSYIMNSKSSFIMEHDNIKYKVKYQKNQNNKQLQINLSQKKGKKPVYTIIKSTKNRFTYDEIIEKCNEYCLTFGFDVVGNKGKIKVEKVSEIYEYEEIKDITQIFSFLIEDQISTIFPHKINNIEDEKVRNKKITLKRKELNKEESFKKYIYRSRNPKLQNEFRNRLIEESEKLNNGKTCCALCNKQYPSNMLIASHIIPVRSLNNPELHFVKKMDNDFIYSENNGLLLCPNHDMLLDKELISFDKDFKIVLGNIDKETLSKFNLEENFQLLEKNRNANRLKSFEYHLNDMILLRLFK